MMQPPNMGVVPGSMPAPGPGPGPVPVGPPGNHQTACILASPTELIVVASPLYYKHRLLSVSVEKVCVV